MLGVEYVRIGHDTNLATLKKELRGNDAAFRVAR
jgi:L-arabinose isomerase